MSSIRSPLQFKKQAPQGDSLHEAVMTITGVSELLQELYQLRTDFAEKMGTMQTLEDKVQGGWTEEVQALKQDFNARIDDVITRLEARTPTADLERIISNVKGEAGYTPIKGIDYIDGVDGEAPTDEYLLELITPLLPEAINGVDGLPGKDADEKIIVDKVLAKVRPLIPKPAVIKPVDEAALVAKVLEQLPETKVTVDDIEGFDDMLRASLDKHQQRLGYLHGGGDTIAAGSGVTITNTNGTKVISTSSGAGFQQATGTIDGSNTVFVFATAPRAICVDGGRSIQRISSDGTVNWTVVGSTVTLSIAPTFDVFGIA